ncbi:reverse transcriptase-rnase h-integrase, partial [Moniliophthora roreri]
MGNRNIHDSRREHLVIKTFPQTATEMTLLHTHYNQNQVNVRLSKAQQS